MLGKHRKDDDEIKRLLDWDFESKMKIPREEQEDDWYGDLNFSYFKSEGILDDGEDVEELGRDVRAGYGIRHYEDDQENADDPAYGFAEPTPYAGDNEENWALPGILVTVHKLGEDSSPVGVVQEIHPDGFCSVALKSNKNEEMLIARHNEIKIVPPKMSDKIKVIGEDCRGVSGELNDAEGSV